MARRSVGARLVAVIAVGSSVRGDRRPARPRSVVDVAMLCSVALAVACFAVWFFLFAGSGRPTT
jgi:multisubunit Na+/H+ antiporter MnhB subunit